MIWSGIRFLSSNRAWFSWIQEMTLCLNHLLMCCDEVNGELNGVHSQCYSPREVTEVCWNPALSTSSLLLSCLCCISRCVASTCRQVWKQDCVLLQLYSTTAQGTSKKNWESYIFWIVGMKKWKSTVCIGAVLTGHFPVQVDACLVSTPCCVFTQRQRAGQSSNAQSEEGRCLGL